MSEPELLIERHGRTGCLTLNRPAALNALTLGMVHAITAALNQWRDDPEIAAVMIAGAGPRAFCAGGDISDLYTRGKLGDFGFAHAFWRAEYAMNDQIGTYRKPVVTFIHGFCLGGGVGVACHARYRIVGETARISLPECGIGLVPDVGGTRLLARAQPGVGAYLGLTGARMEPGPAIEAGFADSFIPEADWPVAKAALCATGDLASLTRYFAPAPTPRVGLPGQDLRQVFAADSFHLLLDQLALSDAPGVSEARAALAAASPLSVATAFAMQHQLSPSASLQDALQLEYRAVRRALEAGDFLEGIRARIVDRDNAPHWRHASPADVTLAEVAAMLAPLGGDELDLRDQTEC
jgi:enoyl-CoA hydratase